MKPAHPHACPPPGHPASRQGSSLTVVMIVMFLASFMAASLLTLGTHEKDLTYRRIADVEGRHALESAVEIAMADLQQHFRESQTVTKSVPSISLDSTLVSLLTTNTQYVTDVRITGVTNRQHRDQVFVDARDPDTTLDPHRGSYVNVSEWTIQAEADLSYRGQTRTMQAAQSFQVRESPFFTHAILYNMDLEFHPGPSMIINGPVHSNGTIWALAHSSLHFLDRVTATEGIHIGGMLLDQQSDWNSGYFSKQSGTKVWFNTNGRQPTGAKTNKRSGEWYANLWDGSGDEQKASSYFDARSEASGKLFSKLGFTNMSEFLSNWFDGNLAMGSIEAPLLRSQFIPNYVPDDGSGNRLNYGYALIEPLMRKTDHLGQPNPYFKNNGEREKFAYKAGLTFAVKYLPGFDAANLTDDQAHWRQLWEPGFTPVPPPHYAQTFNSMAEGELHGQLGFEVEDDTEDFEVVEDGLVYQNGEVDHDISSMHVEVDSKETEYAHVDFPELDGEEVYFSYLFHVPNFGNKTEFHFGITGDDDFDDVEGMKIVYTRGPSSGEIRAHVGSDLDTTSDSSKTVSVGDITDNNVTYLLVGRLYKSSPTGDFDSAEVLLNPTTLGRPSSGWATVSHDTGISGINRLFFRGVKAKFNLSDIRVGTEYRQVVGKQQGPTDYWLIPQKVKRTNAFDLDTTDMTVFNGASTLPAFDPDGNTSLLVEHDPVYIDHDVINSVFRARIYDEDSNGRPVTNGGLYDKRDLKPQDLIAIDMGAFKTEIVETTDLDRFRKPLPDGTKILTYTPANEFNGVLYFQFPLPDYADLVDRPDDIIIARDNFRPFTTAKVDGKSIVARDDHTSLSLFVHNAKQIPNPAYNADRVPGFTFATNTRVYLHGHYNADGLQDTGSSATADGDAEYDALAAIAADAISCLSENFTVERSKNNSIPASASFTEVNAAVMSGILPTNTEDLDSRYTPRHDYPTSGGSHNYHRFLERFSGRRFRYRGSLVAFYESELARSPQEQKNNTWYGAPNRDYGFYEIFGTGAQPPGTPMARTFFKMDFRFN